MGSQQVPLQGTCKSKVVGDEEIPRIVTKDNDGTRLQTYPIPPSDNLLLSVHFMIQGIFRTSTES